MARFFPQSNSLTDQIFNILQDAIIRGEIPAGSKISEPELAKTYGVRRGTLREALSRLEERHLIIRHQTMGHGSYRCPTRNCLKPPRSAKLWEAWGAALPPGI